MSIEAVFYFMSVPLLSNCENEESTKKSTSEDVLFMIIK